MPRPQSNAVVTREHSLSGEKLSLLAIFAHPEDESFGPAGTLFKYASEGVAVSLVAATRSRAVNEIEEMDGRARDRLCSCRASGIRRACLFDYRPGELTGVPPAIIEERLVRVIREIQPQVVITFGPEGLAGDSDNRIISAAATAAFREAGDSSKFQDHLRDGLEAYAPKKLYYCVLPESLVSRWGAQGLFSVPDAQITTVLDVSSYGEAMKNALYCQRHSALDLVQRLSERYQVQWKAEHYVLIESRLNRRPRREKDLFAGLR